MLNYILPSIAVFLIYLIIFGLNYKKRRLSVKHFLKYSILVIYIILVMDVTLFPLPVDSRLIADTIKYNLGEKNNFIPFHSIIETMNNPIGMEITLKQIGGNLLLLFPLGFYLPLVIKKVDSFFKVLLISFLFSLSIEVIQWTISLALGFSYRSTDVDDIILNTLGSIVAYFIMRFLLPTISEIVDVKHLENKQL